MLISISLVFVRNYITKISELVGISDDVGVLCRAVTACKGGCNGAIPSVFLVLNDSHLREGCHVKSDISGCGIIFKLIMSSEGVSGRNISHCHGLAILNVIKLKVSDVESARCRLGEGDLHRNCVIRSNAFYVDVYRFLNLVILEGNVCITVALGDVVNGKGKLIGAVFELNATGDVCSD